MTARSLLFLMLITVFGQVMAQSCADLHGQMAVTTAMNAAQEKGAAHHGSHSDAPTEDASRGAHCGDSMAELKAPHCDTKVRTAEECGQGCTCCPSHCASVLPIAEGKTTSPAGSDHINTYSDIASSPEPESAIRPPISA